ncbi:MAG: branched-chain amino acid ABC transporter permease [Thermoprotei archaeon]
MDSRTLSSIGLPALLVILVGMAVPFLAGFNQYYVLLALQSVVMASIALAWNIIGGYAGQLDLASFAYIGLGGILATMLMMNYNVTPWLGMFLGAGISATLAFVIGYPLFRFGIKGVWYALSTAALVVILHEVSIMVLGPFDYYIPFVEGWYYLRFRTWENLYYFSLVVLASIISLNLYISRSKIGYYLKAIREDEVAAEAVGIDIRKYKLLALVIYASILGFIGYIYIVSQRTFSYNTFSGPQSVYVAIIGIVGGLGSVSGVFTAALVLKIVEEYLRGYLGGVLPGLHLLLFGVLLIAVGILRPEGLSTLTDTLARKIKTRVRGGARE